MKFLILLIFIIKINSAIETQHNNVDTQVTEWKKIYNSFRLAGANWKETHVSELSDRIRYTADYAEKSLQHLPERSEQVRIICDMISEKIENNSLTFQWAMRCFDALAKICDQKRNLELITEELPKSYFEERFENSRSFLRNSDIYFLCVPTAMLKIERFVDGYLQERPTQYITIANKELEKGGHGDYYKTVYDTYHHDLQHAYYFLAIGGKHFKYFWPAYKIIKEIREISNFWEKNILDTFLHTYFHEIYADAYKFYKSADGSFSLPADLDRNFNAFSTFIDNMELANTRFDLRINFDAINWSKRDASHYSKLISSHLDCPYNDDTVYRLRNSSSLLIEDYLPSSTEDTITISDVLEITNKRDSSIVEEISCTVQIENIANPLSTVHITTESKTCTFSIYGPGHKAPHYFQDVLYLLSHAKFISPREIYKPVTIFNYAEVRDLAIQMRADAIQILKDKFKFLPNSLSNEIDDSLNISN